MTDPLHLVYSLGNGAMIMSTPTETTPEASDPRTPSEKKEARGCSDGLREAKAAKRAAAEAYQALERVAVDGYIIQPTIGKTGGADNVGWELIPQKGTPGRPWYLRSREEALEAVQRHRSIYH